MLSAEPIRRVILLVSGFYVSNLLALLTQEERRFSLEAQRGPNGRYLPVEEVQPLPEDNRVTSGLRLLPPPPTPSTPSLVPSEPSTDLPAYVSKNNAHNAYASASRYMEPSVSGNSSAHLAQMHAVDRSRVQKLARMEPHLQFMVGPLLRYDTVDENGLWRGAALIVSKCTHGLVAGNSGISTIMFLAADSGSSYEPFPVLTYQWDPEENGRPPPKSQGSHSIYDLGPHPADPHTTAMAGPLAQSSDPNDASFGDYKRQVNMKNDQTQHVTGQEIYVYAGNGG